MEEISKHILKIGIFYITISLTYKFFESLNMSNWGLVFVAVFYVLFSIILVDKIYEKRNL